MTIVKFKKPSESFETIIRIIRFSASICGIDLLRPNYRMNWITYTLFTSIALYYVFVAYTIRMNYKDDWTIFLKATVTMGTSLQGVSKLYAFISNKNVIIDLYHLLSGIYRDYEKMGGKLKEALETSLQKTRQGLYSLLLLYVIGYVGLITVPYGWLIVTGVRSLVIEFQIPGLDIKTDTGYFITLGFQTGVVICFAFGLYCGDSLALVYFLQSFMFSYIFAVKIDNVNEMVENPENNRDPKVTKALKDIVKWHQLFSDYTDRCNNLFYYVITVQFLSAFFSTVLSIYLIMAGGWPGAYSYVMISICCLYIYCILGTENQTANEKFESDIYSIHWYNLTVSQQKLILQILCKTQHPNIIDVAGVMPLSVSTALQISKTIYSLTMGMIQLIME